ncbi:MAG TPA: hypothetical protein PLG77_01320 [Burkholderiaceae bacterium]|nr:hypothetical protein [Burkholderiaceae bacterium]
MSDTFVAAADARPQRFLLAELDARHGAGLDRIEALQCLIDRIAPNDRSRAAARRR